jgi:ABC-type phosphate transport system substrate-binding protein
MPTVLEVVAMRPPRFAMSKSSTRAREFSKVSPQKKRNKVKKTKAVAFAAALGVALTGFALAAPASADPVSDSYTIVGSDTLQDAVNALVNGTGISGSYVRSTTGGNNVASFDATGSTVIQVKSAGPFLGRPSGSGDGKKALSRALDGANWTKNGVTANVVGQIDLARSSSGASSSAGNGDLNASGPLVFIPFGRDAVAYAYKFGAGKTIADAAGLDTLTAAQLLQIYNGTTTTIGTTTVVPRLPQASSGTRQFFLGAIGAGTASNPAGVPDAATTTAIENDGTVLTPAAGTVQLIPFSAASWIAQNDLAAPVNTTTGVALGHPEGVAPFTGTGSSLVPNSTFYSGAVFGRDIYIIAPAVKILAGAQFDQNLADLVDPTKITSLTYFGASGSPATAKAVKLKFGFLAPSTTATFRTNYFS